MVHYSPIRFWKDDDAKRRVIDNLIPLRAMLYKEIGRKRDRGSFMLATWNLRDFDSNKFGHGHRLDESYYYIAETINAFDLVALQEINRDMKGLKLLMRALGRDWDYVATDTTEGTSGNQERMAFVYRKSVIGFGNMAGEIVLPGTKDRQFARTPFVAAFQAGWFRFNLCTAHIYYGETSGDKFKRRVKEISDLASFLRKRQERETEDFILLGDFNIVDEDDPTMSALTDEGFTVPPELFEKNTTLAGKNPYDQLALRVKNKMLEIGNAGVFDFEHSVFKDEDFDLYRPFMRDDLIQDKIDSKNASETKRAKKAGRAPKPLTPAQERDVAIDYYKMTWRSFQISDHKPMWVELKVDFTDHYLRSLRPDEEPLADLDPPGEV